MRSIVSSIEELIKPRISAFWGELQEPLQINIGGDCYMDPAGFVEAIEEEKEELKVAAKAADYITKNTKKAKKIEGYGLCSTCRYFFLIESNDAPLYSVCCDYFTKFHPNKVKPVTNCSNYWNSSWYSYDYLKEIAWLLETKKGKVGFIKPEPKEED